MNWLQFFFLAIVIWTIGFLYAIGRADHLIDKGTLKRSIITYLRFPFYLLVAWPYFLGRSRDD